ncbi:MAG: NAD(P)H-dependent oxidoreductase subunit E [Oscillospiraceae bacterium]|nr:NAD(P)H-dependent oxidoreductase subunit E [Oscillospiraceae bacterium]
MSTAKTDWVVTPEMEQEIISVAKRYHDEPHQLMRILLAIQKIAYNSFPREVAVLVSRETGLPEADLYSYITYYAMFSAEPRGKFVIRMCESAPCHVRGAKAVMEAISRTLGIEPGETTKDGRFTLEYCQCLGMCVEAPCILINDKVYKDLTPGRAAKLMEDYMSGEVE